MKKIVIAAASLVLSSIGVAQNWTFDPAHSSVKFSIVHLGISDVEGSFKKFDAKLTAASPNLTDAVFEFTADVSSINTDNEKRDQHLQSPDFFDATKYPTVTFKSKSVKKVADNQYNIIGELTMHGITKLIELKGTMVTTTHPMSKKTVAGVRVSGVIKRSNFNLAPSTPEAMLSDDVQIKGSAEFSKD